MRVLKVSFGANGNHQRRVPLARPLDGFVSKFLKIYAVFISY